MNTPHKFVSELNEYQIAELKKIMKNGDSHRTRTRAHSILLSSKKMSIDEISLILDSYRDSVSSWIDAWEERGTESLSDKPRSGAPCKLTENEIEVVKETIKEHPHSPKIILAKMSEKINKTVSISTLKRIVKKADMRWKRVKKSVKGKRDEKEYEKKRRNQHSETAGKRRNY